MNAKLVWDLGPNTRVISRITSSQGIIAVSIFCDPGVVESNYLRTGIQKEKSPHSLHIDLTNPSGGISRADSDRVP